MRQHRFFFQVSLTLASLLLILILTACSGFGSDGSQNNTPSQGSSASTTPASASSPSSDGTGAASGATATPTPTATSAPQPAAFQVTGIAASVNHPTFTGICGNTISRTFTGVIYAPANTPGGTVTYHWIENGGGVFSTQTISFAAGQTARTVTETSVTGANWGNGSTLWLELVVTAPNSFTSKHVNFSFICQRKVTQISASSTTSNACNSANHTFQFSATITVSPGPGSVTVTYHWYRSDGGTGTSTMVTIPDSQTTATVTNSWSLFTPITNGTYWEEVIATSPNGDTSNHATFLIVTC